MLAEHAFLNNLGRGSLCPCQRNYLHFCGARRDEHTSAFIDGVATGEHIVHQSDREAAQTGRIGRLEGSQHIAGTPFGGQEGLPWGSANADQQFGSRGNSGEFSILLGQNLGVVVSPVYSAEEVHGDGNQHVGFVFGDLARVKRHKHSPGQCQAQLVAVLIFEFLDSLGQAAPIVKGGKCVLEVENLLFAGIASWLSRFFGRARLLRRSI